MVDPVALPSQTINELIDSSNVKIKHPKRVLHFSDGTLEEFSDDDDDDIDGNVLQQQIAKKNQFTEEVITLIT